MGKTLAGCDIAPFVPIAMSKDLQACRDAIKPRMALYSGGMGARGKISTTTTSRRMGYEAEAARSRMPTWVAAATKRPPLFRTVLIDEIASSARPNAQGPVLQVWKESDKDGAIGTDAAGRRQHRGAARRAEAVRLEAGHEDHRPGAMGAVSGLNASRRVREPQVTS